MGFFDFLNSVLDSFSVSPDNGNAPVPGVYNNGAVIPSFGLQPAQYAPTPTRNFSFGGFFSGIVDPFTPSNTSLQQAVPATEAHNSLHFLDFLRQPLGYQTGGSGLDTSKLVLTGSQVYSEIQRTFYDKVRAANASRSISWGELFVGLSNSELHKIPTSTLNNLQKTAAAADIAASIWGVSDIRGTGTRGSGMRLETGAHGAEHSAHKLGLGIDVRPPAGMSAKTAAEKLLASKRMPGDIGWNPYANFVHIGGAPNPYNNGQTFFWTYTVSGTPTNYKRIA